MITQARLKEALDYNPRTGVFMWLEKVSRNTIVGTRAGNLDYTGYRVLSLDKKKFREHRLAWFYTHGLFPSDQIDHINGVRDDNRMVNLREASCALNARNRALQTNSKSGRIGVYFDAPNNKWRAMINDEAGNKVCLGRYSLLEDAIDARADAEKLYGYHQNHGRQAHAL